MPINLYWAIRTREPRNTKAPPPLLAQSDTNNAAYPPIIFNTLPIE